MHRCNTPWFGLALLACFLPCLGAHAGAADHLQRDQQRYGHITRLENLEPEKLGTYEDYIAQHPFRPMVHRRLIPRGGRLIPLDKARRLPVTASAAGPKALVIVNTTLRPQIEPRLTRYITDLQAQGFDVVVEESEGGTPEDLKALIISHETDLVGVALVGEQPAAWFEIDENGFPCDVFFMDLDGTWHDLDGDGLYDEHEAGSGDEAPEICIGRIAAHNMSGDEVAMLDHYFDKNHDYRTGVIRCAEKGLTYVSSDWANWPEANYGIARAYPNFDNMTPPDLSEPDCLDRISNGLYEFVQLCAHSSSGGHSIGGWVTTSEIQNAPPIAVFYNLFACGAGRFTNYNWVAGGYVYNTTGQGITCIACSRSGSMTNYYHFYGPFGEGETFGESFRSYMEYLAPYTGSDRSWQFGLNIQGDPFAVEDPPLPFRLYAPVGGETWHQGEVYTIEWTHTDVAGPDISIELLKGASAVGFIAASTPNDDEFDWNVPSDMTPGTDYRVRITSISNPAYTDTSPQYFTIQESAWERMLDDPCLFPHGDVVTPPEEPRLRTNVAAIADGEKLYVIGGNGDDYTDSDSSTYWGNRQATFSIFDPLTKTWSAARYDADHPIGYNNGSGSVKPDCGKGTGSCHMAAVAYDCDGDAIPEPVTFGGYPIWGGNGMIYDPDTDSWSKTPNKPDHSGGGYKACLDGMHALIGSVYYQYGGSYNGPDQSTFWTYDFASLQWLEMPPGPVRMVNGTGAAVAGKFYLISGKQNDVAKTTDCWAYDPATLGWNSIADIPTGVNKAPALVLQDRIFVFGGSSSSGDTDAIQIYDPAGDSWSVSPVVLPVAWSSQGAAYLDGYVYLMDGNGGGRTNACYRISVGHLVENADCDADGLPDLWETTYFGSLRYGPDDDPDGDGATNSEERAAGTNPADPNSFFGVAAVAWVTSGPDSGVHVTCNTVEGRSHLLYYCDEDYSTGMIWRVCSFPVIGDGSPHTFVDRGDVGRPSPFDPSVRHRYYKVVAE